MARLGAQLDLAMLIAKHNDEGDDFHFDLHTIILLGLNGQVELRSLS